MRKLKILGILFLACAFGRALAITTEYRAPEIIRRGPIHYPTFLKDEGKWSVNAWKAAYCRTAEKAYVGIEEGSCVGLPNDPCRYHGSSASPLTSLYFGSSIMIKESINIENVDLNFFMIMIYMGLCVSTLTIIFQNWGQKENKNPVQTAIIFNLEPVFAAFFAFLIGNEILTWIELTGCMIIFIAICIAVYEKKK